MSLVGEWDIIGTTRENSSIYGVPNIGVRPHEIAIKKMKQN